MPHLKAANETHQPDFILEYLTFQPSQLHPTEGSDGRDSFAYPIPLHHLPRSLRNSSVTESKYTPYKLPDLTIPSWVKLARRIADPKHKKLQKRFRKYMYLGGEEG